MTNKKSTKRALLMSVLSLFLCVAMLAGTTFAWFTDSVASKNNVITTGNLDVELEYKKVEKGVLSPEWETVGGRDDIFDPNAYWEPGRVEVVYLKVSNLGSLALKYQLGVNVVKDNPGTNVDGDTFYLSEHLVFKTVLIEEKDVGTYTRATAVEDGDTLGFKDYNGKTTPLQAKSDDPAVNDEDYVALIVYMPESVGNVANHKKSDDPLNPAKYAASIEFGINLFATQYTVENDSYGNDYDDDAWVDGFKVTTANDLQAAINNGETNIVLMNDIELTESIVIPAPATTTYALKATPTVIDLNGKTITGNNTRADGALIVNNGFLVLNGNNQSAISNQATDGAPVIQNNGTLVINGGRYVAAPWGGTNTAWPSYAINSYSDITINGGVIVGSHGAVSVNDGSTGVINGGDISITGCKLLSDHVLYAPGASKLTVNGGNFTMAYDSTVGGDTLFSGNCVVTDGTFNEDPSKYVATDYAAVDNGNGTWSVIFPQDSFNDLIDNAQPGVPVEVPVGNFTLSGNNELEIVGQGEDTVITFDGSIKNANISNATIGGDAQLSVGANQKVEMTNVVFEGVAAKSGSAYGTLIFTGCTFNGLLHFDSSSEVATVKFIGCTFTDTCVIKLGGNNDPDDDGAHYIMENCVVETLDSSVTSPWGKEWLITYADITLTDCELGRQVRAGSDINITLDNCFDANNAAVTEKIVYINYPYSSPVIMINGVAWARNTGELQNALASGKTDIRLTAGTYELPRNNDWYGRTDLADNTKIVGAEDGVYVTPVSNGSTGTWEQGRFSGNNFTFENVTFTNTVSPSGYGNFVNCVFNGDNGLRHGAYQYGNTTYTNCTFNNADGWAFHTEYIYGVNVTFEECTFTGLVEFTDSIDTADNVCFNNCTFKGSNKLASGKIFYSWKNNAVLTDCTGYDANLFAGCTVNP